MKKLSGLPVQKKKFKGQIWPHPVGKILERQNYKRPYQMRKSGVVVSKLDSRSKVCGFKSHPKLDGNGLPCHDRLLKEIKYR